MINFLRHIPKAGNPVLWFTLMLMLSPPFIFSVESAEKSPKYKKNTVVDFEGALVEGKSRKPYSAYLTQQKESAFGDLYLWQVDLDKSLSDSQTKLDKTP